MPRKSGYDNIDTEIPAPISQHVTGTGGMYQQYNITKNKIHVRDFKELANSEK